MVSMNLEYTRPPDRVTELIGEPGSGMKLKVRHARLKVLKGPDKGLEKAIPLHGLIVGKGASSNFVLTDPAVSLKHFRLVPVERGFLIEDLGSSNGTWLKNARLGSAYIAHKEEIKVGYSILRLEVLRDHEEHPLSVHSSFGNMLGHSVAMRQVFSLLERAANSDATLLLEGESGTGKDLAAESVHAFSARGKKPFVIVDCGSIKANLLETHLFGHVKGAFTGATSDHVGAFETAHGGTVFLDEIGELDPALQPKLLRVLEKRQVQRIGETAYRSIDVRLIAATNRHLDSEIKTGCFREDLFYRLSVLRVHIPSLRDRHDDIPLLASAIIRQLDPETDPSEILSDEVLALLANHDWPGNVRELRNVIERLLLFPEWSERVIQTNLSENNSPDVDDPFDLPFPDAKNLVLERFEKRYIASLLQANQGIVSRAARRANMTRQTLHRLMNKYGVYKAESQE